MPVSSNYQVSVSALTNTEVGALPKPPAPEPGFNWWGLARILTTIATIGATLIPGVGVVAATGISAVGAAAFTGIDVATGNASAINLSITWASALIPGASQFIKGGAAVGKIATAVEEAEGAALAAREAAMESSNAFGGFIERVAAEGRVTELKNIQNQVTRWTNPHDLKSIVEKSLESTRSAYQQDINQANSFFNELSAAATNKTGEPFNAMQYAEYALTNDLSQAQMEAIRTDFFNLTGQHLDTAMARFKLLENSQSALAGGLSEHAESLVQTTTEVLGRRGDMIIAEVAEETQDDIRNYGRSTAEFMEVELELRRIFGDEKIDELLLSIRNAGKSEQQSRIMDWIRQNLGREEAEKLVLRMDNAVKLRTVTQNVPKGYIDKHLYALKHPFGSKFAELWVQKLQMIDPNDVGRAPAEALYKLLRKRFAKFFERAAVLEKGFKKLEDMKESFEKLGGVLVNSQRIIGYKVIHKVGVKTLIMISFNPMLSKLGGTASEHVMWNGLMTKNYKGKKPVFVEATDLQLEELREGGFSYYLDTWAFNHGGNAVGGKFFGMGGMLSGMTHLLPWINTTALRSWLSITSNWVENVYDMTQGEYISKTTGKRVRKTTTWLDKALRSLKRTGISRGGRLFAQGFIRPIVGGKAGFFIGKEMQRIIGAATSGLNNAMEKKKGTFSERFGKSFKSQLLPRSYQAGASYTNRVARARGAYGSQTRAVQRKLGFLRRPISAATPNAILNPRGFTKF